MIARRLRMNTIAKSSVIRLISYLTDDQGHDQRVGELRITNCEADDPQWAALEMKAIQNLNTRTRGDKTYHLMLSFQEHEHPSPEVLHALEDAICAKLGFTEHQRLSVVHGDTDNLHLHICINKIHPERLTIHEPYYDYKTLEKMSEQLERQYGLAVDNHVPKSIARETAAINMEKAGDLESLIGWIQRNCLEDLQQVGSWTEMHEILASHGLVIKERGNGLVIASGDQHVKASSVDRNLSKKHLEARLGTFEPKSQTKQPEMRNAYSKKPMQHREFNSSALWQTYQKFREEQDQEHALKSKAARSQRDAELVEARDSADMQTLAIRHMVQGAALKKVLYALNRSRLERKNKEIRERYQAARSHVRPRQSWAHWLQAEAMSGNTEALAAMRARDARHDRNAAQAGLVTQSQTAQGTSAAVKITRKGTIIYHDGSRDNGRPQKRVSRVPPMPPVYSRPQERRSEKKIRSRGR